MTSGSTPRTQASTRPSTTDQPLGKLVAYVLEPDSTSKPAPPYADAVEAWEELEQFVDTRLRRE